MPNCYDHEYYWGETDDRGCPFCEWLKADKRIAELEMHLSVFDEDNDRLVQENKALREMVVRMYHHCTVEKAEMTEAESDEWMTKAGALLESGYE